MGHRNPQAIVMDSNGHIYAHEHGPKGGDEINIILPGKNYGWPVITRGEEYSGKTISTIESAPGMEPPLINWTPSIAPSGMTWYGNTQFKDWQGDLLLVSLKEQKVRRIDLQNGKALSDTEVLTDIRERMRDIRTGPDGSLYILTDEEQGKLLKISMGE
jgi:glucose/arabinose dehydrogenase